MGVAVTPENYVWWAFDISMGTGKLFELSYHHLLTTSHSIPSHRILLFHRHYLALIADPI
jgi:hypothetical protein